MHREYTAADMKLLLTGASGFLGWNIAAQTRDKFEVHAVVHSHRILIPGAEVHRIDLTDFRELKYAFQKLKPDAVIHAAAASQPNYCQQHRTESRRINVDAALNIAGLAADHGARLVFVSTDLVFDGKRSLYTEDDPVSPISVYAEQKVAAEAGIRDRSPDAAICRMPLMFGEPGPVANSFVQPFLKSMRAGERLNLFTDEYRTPVNARTASEGILLALESANGLLHLGGSERISRHDFGILLADVLEIRTARIEPCLQKDVPMAAPRPSDVSLDSTRAQSLGYHPISLHDQIAELKGIL